MAPELEERGELAFHVKEIVTTLRDAGAKLVCIDFDATFVSIHTGGLWAQSAVELTKHVRQVFHILVPAMFAEKINVAIVTFSPQVDLIRSVLSLCFPKEIADKLIVRCDDSSWALNQTDVVDFVPTWQLCGMHVDRAYKLPYVISAAIQASTARGELICNRDTILIDDDVKNIRIANDNGITGIYFEPQGMNVAELSQQIKKLHGTSQSPCKQATIRLITTPEPPSRPRRVSSSARQRPPAVVTSMARPKKFSMCTPSPVVKLKYTVDMGRPQSKRARRLRQCSRNIEEDMQAFQSPHETIARSNNTEQVASMATASLSSSICGPPPEPKQMLATLKEVEDGNEEY
jgi:hypothetical protein